jgi:thiamine-phosphate pyrophosphorylase
MAAAAVAGGATLLQLRLKSASTRDHVAAAREVAGALAGTAVPLIVNDRVDVALLVGAGAHLGQDDMDPGDARRLLGPERILGVTLHHPHEAARLAGGIADYAGLGPVFATASKVSADPPLGPDGLARLVAAVRRAHPGLPCCAIAGIDHGNAPAVIAAGVAGVAVISDIFMADDVTAATARLRAAVDAALATRRAA